MKRITQIEGLRAYLAFWVMFGHIIGNAGYALSVTGTERILYQGAYAVDIFIIISGFVIFYLLDQKNESYACFIIRRFFRLWPLFIILYFISIPMSLVDLSNTARLQVLYPVSFPGGGDPIASWWQYIGVDTVLHVLMLHGIVPDALVPAAPIAFLGQAWSISLEWQFYLIAPLVFLFVSKPTPFRVTLVSAAVVVIFVAGKFMPPVRDGAFLPMHVEYFYFGGVSYFLFQRLSTSSIGVRLFPLACACSCFLWLLSRRIHDILPICFWIPFLCLLVDRANKDNNDFTRRVSWLFDNPWTQYLGRISYSIYLSHVLVITVCQFLILHLLHSITQKQNFILLGILTIPVTVAVSSVLHKAIEKRGIHLGGVLAQKIRKRELIRLGSPPAKALEGP